MAPAKASSPPAAQVERNGRAAGTEAAICGGVKRMPPPITLETISAAASRGPRRRSRSRLGAVVVTSWRLYERDPRQRREILQRLSAHRHAVDRKHPHGGPVVPTVLAQNRHVEVDELAVFEKLRP